MIHLPHMLPIVIWQKPGLPWTWSSLSQAFCPSASAPRWAGTEHFQLILSF